MSVRVYSGPHADRRRGGSGGFSRMLPWLLALATILAQIAWPLTHGDTRDTLTVVTVVLFFLTSASHAWLSRGLLWTLGWFVLSAGLGFGVEVLGTRTGLPFGDYTYAGSLGPTVAGVPVVIPLAWAMMSYPALLAARRLVSGPLMTPVVAAVALASWDLFLDPQMVAEGHWTWALDRTPVLLGITNVPVAELRRVAAGGARADAAARPAAAPSRRRSRGRRRPGADVPLDLRLERRAQRRVPAPAGCRDLGRRRDGTRRDPLRVRAVVRARLTRGVEATVAAGAVAAWVATAHTAYNLHRLRTPPTDPPVVAERVSVLVPARDEAARIGPCIDALLASEGIRDLEVLVLDDASSDGTADVVRLAHKAIRGCG